MAIAVIAVVIVAILLVAMVFPNIAKEKEYTKGLEAIENQDYAVAGSIFSDLAQEDYKDSKNVIEYIQMRSSFETLKNANDVDSNGIVAEIDSYSDKLGDSQKSLIDNEVISKDMQLFADEIRQYKSTLEDTQEETQNRIEPEEQETPQEKEQFLQGIVETANTYGYYKAALELSNKYGLELKQYANTLPNSPQTATRALISSTGDVDEDVRTLYLYYIHKEAMDYLGDAENAAREKGKDYETYKEDVKKIGGTSQFSTYQALVQKEAERDVLAGISPDYQGFLSDEINAYCLAYFGSKEEWKKQYEAFTGSESQLADAPMQKEKPEIGMTANEVMLTTWGAPETVNKTEIEQGTHEQWVYSGNRYVYLDNGIVTAIQE